MKTLSALWNSIKNHWNLIKDHRKIICSLTALFLLPLGFRIYLIYTGSENNFFKGLTLGASTSIFGALVAFIAIDLVLEMKKEPMKEVAYKELASLLYTTTVMVLLMVRNSDFDSAELKQLDRYRELYTKSKADQICKNLRLDEDAPVPKEYDFSWSEYLINKTDYLSDEVDSFILKFGDYLEEEVILGLEKNVRRNFLDHLNSFTVVGRKSSNTLGCRFLEREFKSMKEFLEMIEPFLGERGKELPIDYTEDGGPFS